MRVILKKIWILLFAVLFGITANASEEPEQLYAQSAVVMDADSGRVLFEKNGFEKKAMASTTKIMTCILALESGKLEDTVSASAEAVRQPKVHLGVREGETFRLRDLLYSLMLESHNDSAVMIAEQVGGSVEQFADMMNEKAREIGCTDTYFITPNGLDAVDENGKHSTTAEDLARIMSYCIMKSPKKEEFLKITGQKSYQFSNEEKSRTFICNNHNAFLTMMEGACSGKTGFTGDAGYCYVGALKRDDRTFVVALLGCGWPNNKSYKWADTKKLMNYALDNYRYRDIDTMTDFETAAVQDGIPNNETLGGKAELDFAVDNQGEEMERALLREDEDIRIETDIKREWKAPVKKGEQAGTVSYYLGDELLKQYDIKTVNAVEKITFRWCLEKVFEMYIGS